MKIYLVWNEQKTEGFFTTDPGVAYEMRKLAWSNCYAEDGTPSFAASFYDDNKLPDNFDLHTIQEIEI